MSEHTEMIFGPKTLSQEERELEFQLLLKLSSETILDCFPQTITTIKETNKCVLGYSNMPVFCLRKKDGKIVSGFAFNSLDFIFNDTSIEEIINAL